MVRKALANVVAASAGSFMTDNRTAYLAAAEVSVLKALSKAPQHAIAHMQLGFIQISTDRAAQGIAECERALALDRNLAGAHAWIGLAKIFTGRASETETHIHEALRLSPRDTGAFRWVHFIGVAKLHLEADADAVVWFRRGLEENRNFPIGHFLLAAALALLGHLDEARDAAQSGRALDPIFTIRRYRVSAPSNNPTFLAQRERAVGGMRMAGVPEG